MIGAGEIREATHNWGTRKIRLFFTLFPDRFMPLEGEVFLTDKKPEGGEQAAT